MSLRGTAVVVTAALLLVGCHKSDGGKPDQPAEKLVRVALPARPVQLDPAVADDPGARLLMPDLYQTLLTIPPGENAPAPDAADCQFDTPTTYRCTLRSTEATFANGHDLDANDVEHSFERLRTVPGAGRAAALFASVTRIEATRDDTVVFTLRRPDATLPYVLTTAAASIVDQETYPADRVVPPAQTAGSGPYKLTRYAATGSLVLEKFDKYRGTPRPANTKVEVTFPGDVTALAKAVGTATADLAAGFPGGYEPGGSLQTATAPTGRIGYWAFRTRTTATPVRRAVAQLLDREALIRRVYGERVRPLTSVVPDGYEGHTDAFTQSYGTADRTKAAALLRTAGIRTPVRLTIGWTSGAGQKEAEELRRQLQAGGLFAVTVRRTPSAELVQQGLTAVVPDADGFLRPALRPYPSPAVTKLLDQEITAQSRSDRMTALASLQTQSAVDAWVLPVWQDLSAVLGRAEVSGADRVLDRMSGLRLGYLSVK